MLKKIILLVMFFVVLFSFIMKINTQNLFISFFSINIESIFQLFPIIILLLFILAIIIRKIKVNFLFLIGVNLLFPLLVMFSLYLLKNSTIPISGFSFDISYLFLMSSLFSIFILPFIVLRNYNVLKFKNKIVFILVQIVFLILYWTIFDLNFFISLLFIISILIIIILNKSDLIRRILYVMVIATLVSFLTSISFNQLKKEFVSTNLNKIFLNQENYSKLVIGEIIEEFELSNVDLNSFFEETNKSRNENILAKIWNSSLASKEEIASGIYILDKDKKILSQFSYKIPYLNLTPTLELPVWTTEDTEGTLYGKELSVSFGSINVNNKSEHLGYIVIQVLNSPEMILRNSGLTIFGLDKRLKKAKLNYLKLKGHKIIENPLNINLNIVEITKYENKWFKFDFMENRYEAYRFLAGDLSIVIFSPERRLIEWFAEIIKTFLLFIIIFLIMSANEIKKETIVFIYSSLSSRIFIILTFLSLISIILFSIFTVNYNSQTSQKNFRNKMLKNGRIAQNLIGQLLEGGGQLSQNDIFFTANIIDKDIHVYLENEMFFSSNYKEVDLFKIPIILKSSTYEKFGSEKQSYYIEKVGDRFNLFFKVYKYVFCINFAFNENDYNFGKDKSIDFIISLFFLLLLGSLIVVMFVRNKLMAPIIFLNKKMSEVEKGSLNKISNEPSEVELKAIYRGFNSMLTGIEKQKKNISDIARMKTVIKLGRRVAHEVKNPLTPIKLSAEQILRSIEDKKENYDEVIEKSVKYIINETDHLNKVARGFLDLSHIDDMDKKKVDIISLIEDQIVFFQQSYASINFKIKKSIKKFDMYIDKLKIIQLLKNIILNSIEAIEKEEGKIEIEVLLKNDFINIIIADNGVGLKITDVGVLFEEDYSTKKTGTGIGLFVAKRIIELHNGKIEIKSGETKGTIVIISLPVDSKF